MSKKTAVKAIEQADRKVAKGARVARDKPLMRVLGAASDIADQPQLATLCLSVAGFGLIAGRPAVARTGTRMFAAFALATKLKSLVKHAVDRTRPSFAEEDGYQSGKGEHDAADWNSFPSGHTAGAVAVAQVVGRAYPALRPPALALATTVAAIQVPRGKHYVTDLLAGAAIGWVAERLIDRLLRGVAMARTSAESATFSVS